MLGEIGQVNWIGGEYMIGVGVDEEGPDLDKEEWKDWIMKVMDKVNYVCMVALHQLKKKLTK